MKHGYANRFPAWMIAAGMVLLFICSGCKNSATGNSAAPMSTATRGYPTSNARGPARAPRATAEELKNKPTISEVFAHVRKPAPPVPAASGTPVPAATHN